MSVGPCDWMDAVLEGAARNGAPYTPSTDGEWCDTDDFELSADHIVALFADRKELVSALRELLAACEGAQFSRDPFDAVPKARELLARIAP